MQFEEFARKMQEHFDAMTHGCKELFCTAADPDLLWETYLNSFPPGTNEIYRKRREYDCSCCRNFVRHYGTVVAIRDGQLHTIWGFHTGDPTYDAVLKSMDDAVRQYPVCDTFVTKACTIGTPVSHEKTDVGILTWTHMSLTVPTSLVDHTNRHETEIMAQRRDDHHVLKRALDEFETESIRDVLGLIGDNALYRGDAWQTQMQHLLRLSEQYNAVAKGSARDLFVWERLCDVRADVVRIRNTSIGTLLIDINAGLSMEDAVTKYEALVAPTNYRRPKEIYTTRMLDSARRDVENMGYMDSLGRRFATVDDLTVNNALYVSRSTCARMAKTQNPFDEMADETQQDIKQFANSPVVSVEKFLNDVLPGAANVEALLENRHAGNMVSLIAPQNPDAKPLFSWGNSFGWAYAGNLADSMKERVKSAGGKVDGALRFSIQWNECGTDNADLDAHCVDAASNHIYFGKHRGYPSSTGGELDVDIVFPDGEIAVENITWIDKNRMKDGVYQFFVHQYNGCLEEGFRAEIEFDGAVFSFDRPNKTHRGQKIEVADVKLTNGSFSIKPFLPMTVGASAAGKVWGLTTGRFHPVSAVSYSPNYWDAARASGQRHLFFLLANCKNPETPNGFYNEFLVHDLAQHKRVLAALGAKMSVANADDQLSGIGFSMTKRDSVILRVTARDGNKKICKVLF